jgi:FHA domain
MDNAGWKEIETIFHRAARLRGSDRESFLSKACGGDRELRQEVESLLNADAQGDGRLDRPLIDSLDSAEMATILHKDTDSFHRRQEMQQIQCSRGHFYDSEDHVSCPHCGVVGLSADFSPTAPVAPSKPMQHFGGSTKPAADGPTLRKGNSDDAPTQRYSPSGKPSDSQIDPVVGWLVCIEGVDRGRDYRIRAQRNFIGRDVGMDICIAGDDSISRINHATLIYDPRGNAFRIAPGDAHGMTYLNNEAVDVPTPLKPYDTIELGPHGSTKLLFVPFCGEGFRW